MSASSVIYIKTAVTARIPEVETPRAKKTAPRRWFSFRPRQPTTFQRCLALHLVEAERYSALN
jgi:hypothetical protein